MHSFQFVEFENTERIPCLFVWKSHQNENQIRIRIWSQNIWFIGPIICTPLVLRFKKILTLLSSQQFDIICMQEAFSKHYTNQFKQYASQYGNLKYFHHFTWFFSFQYLKISTMSLLPLENPKNQMKLEEPILRRKIWF